MTLETRRCGWIHIAVKLTVLLIAVGATSLPRERAAQVFGNLLGTDNGIGIDPAYRFTWPKPPQYPEAPEAQASAPGRVA